MSEGTRALFGLSSNWCEHFLLQGYKLIQQKNHVLRLVKILEFISLKVQTKQTPFVPSLTALPPLSYE